MTDAPADRRVAVSIVVMGFRNEETIVRAVDSIVGQLDDHPADVVIVTSGGDQSGRLVRERFPGVPVVESSERLLPGGARNAGIEVTTGDAVAFLAADCVAAPGWVSGRIAAHAAGHDAVATPVGILGPTTPVSIAGHVLLYAARLPGRRDGPISADQAHGMSITRSTIEAAGGFDPTLRIGEDTAMSAEISERLGIGLHFDSSIVALHRSAGSLRELLSEQHKRGALRAAWHVGAGGDPGWRRRSWNQFRSRLRVVVTSGWRDRSWPAHQALAAMPLVVAGALANQFGWIAEYRRLTAEKGTHGHC